MNEHFCVSLAVPLTHIHACSFRPAATGFAKVSGASDDDFCSWQVSADHLVTRPPVSEIEVASAKLYSELEVSDLGCDAELPRRRQGISARTHINSGETPLLVLRTGKP